MKESVSKWIIVSLVLFGIPLLLAFIMASSATSASQSNRFFDLAPSRLLSPGPDLAVESITLEPAIPDPGELFTITVVIRNRGTTAAAGFYAYLYLDPADRPPTLSTADTSWTYRYGLGPGESFTWRTSGHSLASIDCNHVAYVWVDRDDQVVEDDENNNLHEKEVCIGATPTPSPTPTATPTPTSTPCVPDAYEPDNACPATAFIDTGGSHQLHNLCPAGDVDWVRLSTHAGITYTIETTGVGEDGDTVLALYDSCGGDPIVTNDPPDASVARLEWLSTLSGEYYIRVNHHSDSYGPATDYDLSVMASTNCQGDLYESDDSCAAAREIATDGTPQTHQFCAASDYDWIKVKVTSGSTVILNTSNLGPDADPMLSVLDSCTAPPSLGSPQQLEWVSPSDTVYYVKVENHDPESYGPTTSYDLSVTTLGCDGDDYEFETGDDSAAQARLVEVNDPAETHNICPAGDEDWYKFAAVAGRKYVIDTFHLALDADTTLCLYDTDGVTELVCDDDGSLTKAARLVWTSPGDGTYYVQARHYDPTTSGSTTQYDISITVGFQVDSFEPDNGLSQASPIQANGVAQLHNFTPISDEDWVKFNASAGQYALQTSNLEPGCDTIMELYDTDGSTLLATSDDFAFGLGSQITYNIPASGTYFVRLRNFRPERFGTNMQYELLLVQGTPPPAPTPPVLATPTPPPSPSPSAVRTLILTNRERIRSLYGSERANQLMNKLVVLASHPRVLGNLILVESDAAVAAAYSEWNADPLSTDKANNVANAVRNLVLTYLANNPNTEYIVIAGSDEVIPFRRTLDRTDHPESTYAYYVSSNTTIWAACLDDMSLTDNYYGDQSPTVFDGHELYIPDYAIGRLVETPEEIMHLIDLFLGGYVTNINTALVTGYDFVQDAAGEICNKLGTDLGGGAVDCSLIGETWSGTQLSAAQLDTVPRFDLQSINGHAGRAVEGAPQPPSVKASEIATLGSSDLNRALVYTLGCHSGMNDTGALPSGMDLAQAFSQRGANYIGNTGYGWGYGNDEIGLSELLMTYLTEELVQGGSTQIGKALKLAKQRYYAETSSFGDYDEKIMIESTLYGLPMAEMVSGTALEGDLFPSVIITTSLPFPEDGLNTAHINLDLAQSFGSFDETETSDGSFFDLDDSVHLGAGEPIQPKFFAEMSGAGVDQVHGAVLTGATYLDEQGFDPVVIQPVNEYYAPLVEPGFEVPGWYPPVPLALHNTATISSTGTLVTTLGQYHAASNVERIYDALTIDVFYSSSYDWWEPVILSVDGILSHGQAQIKVEALDGSDINRVVIVYTSGDGAHQSIDLTYDDETQKWKGHFPATAGRMFYAQAVDGAGNVAVDDNKGAWHSLVEVETGPRLLYMPLVLRQP